MHKVFYQWQVFQKNSKNFRNGKMLENHAFAIASLKSSSSKDQSFITETSTSF